MAHKIDPNREYQLLQQRLDLNVTGAPASPTFSRILELLFTPQQAALARKLPSRPVSVRSVARKLNIPRPELEDQITEMAQRGLVVDFMRKERRYVMLAPVVIGFFEYTFMRTDRDLPMKELALLFDQYMHENDAFARSVFSGQTQVGRSLVREEALPDEPHAEIFDYERATHFIESATAWSVTNCACRHKSSHLGTACDRPLRTCLAFNYAADTLVRNGLAEAISRSEARGILEESKALGLAQTGDNVQNHPTYLCNCCGCCCGMMNAIRTFNIRHAIVTSNWLMDVDLARCNGCGVCVDACPVSAIAIAEQKEEWRDEKGRRRTRRRWAVRDADLCLGCGTCHGACKFGAIQMTPREQRVLTPESTFDRVVSMAIERGKLAGLVFDDPEKLSHRALGRVISVLQNSPPAKAALAVRPLRSAFLTALVGTAQQQAGEMKEDLG